MARAASRPPADHLQRWSQNLSRAWDQNEVILYTISAASQHRVKQFFSPLGTADVFTDSDSV